MAMTELPAGRLDNIEFVAIFTRYKDKWLPESEMDLDFLSHLLESSFPDRLLRKSNEWNLPRSYLTDFYHYQFS